MEYDVSAKIRFWADCLLFSIQLRISDVVRRHCNSSSAGSAAPAASTVSKRSQDVGESGSTAQSKFSFGFTDNISQTMGKHFPTQLQLEIRLYHSFIPIIRFVAWLSKQDFRANLKLIGPLAYR